MKSTKDLLQEINEDELDEKKLDLLTKLQAYKTASQPFWRTNSFLTVIISAGGIIISGYIGLNNLQKTKNAELENQHMSFMRDSTQLKSQLETIRYTIQKSTYDNLLANGIKQLRDIMRTQHQIDSANQELMIVKDSSQKIRAVYRQTLADVIQAQQKEGQLKVQVVALNEAINKQHKEATETIADLNKTEAHTKFEKDKLAILEAFFTLKSAVITVITPSKDQFSGIVVYNPIPVEQRKTKLDALLCNVINNDFFIRTNQKKPAVKIHFDELYAAITKLEGYSTNRFVHNTRAYFKDINPKIDTLISEIDQVGYDEINLPVDPEKRMAAR